MEGVDYGAGLAFSAFLRTLGFDTIIRDAKFRILPPQTAKTAQNHAVRRVWRIRLGLRGVTATMTKKSAIVEHRGPLGDETAIAADQRPPSRRLLRLAIIAVLLFIAALIDIPDYIRKWLWMRELDYVGIFWTLLSIQCGMFCVGFAFAFLYLWINLRHAVSNSAFHRYGSRESLRSFRRNRSRWETHHPGLKYRLPSLVEAGEIRVQCYHRLDLCN